MTKALPVEFTHLVDWSVTELGRVIELELGSKAYHRIEKIRRSVKTSATKNTAGLLRLKKDFEKLKEQERYDIAHAFALMLEVINSCEAAYRSFRLKQENTDIYKPQTVGRIVHVLTAHPTESRNPRTVYYLKEIQKLLEKRLQTGADSLKEDLHVYLRMVWKISLSKQRQPTVMDEAEYIYTLALDNSIIDLLLKNRMEGSPLYLRTWVGGDKDGHPGVDEKTLIGSLRMSRARLVQWLRQQLQVYLADIEPLYEIKNSSLPTIKKMHRQIEAIKKLTGQLKVLQHGDALPVHKLHKIFDELSANHRKIFDSETQSLKKMNYLLRIFPGLVLPLEIREDSALVHEALKQGPDKLNISRMLRTLKKICGKENPRNYVRGFVLSQTESAADIEAGMQLVEKYLGYGRLPVVPLFESAHSLGHSVEIIKDLLSKKKNISVIKKHWENNLEIMLGYSDSAKENGSFPSRFLIQSAVCDLEKVVIKNKITPQFFHGSGGSVERGGGSIQEQTEWWPLSALKTVKVTVQGEMIYRNYTSSVILQRQLNLLLKERDDRNQKPAQQLSAKSELKLRALSDFVEKSYQERLQDPEFLHMIELATPYPFLKDLKLGSRPAKRTGTMNTKSIRAIPWVLCWTQTRILFPSWWGVGSFWKNLSANEKQDYKKIFKKSAVFSSYIKVLGFTLAKIELDIFALYLRSSHLDPESAAKLEKQFRDEYKLCVDFLRQVTGQKNFLWYRPWLETSIELRSPLISPLNVLQVIALEQKNIRLLRETVTGIAGGMLTTG